jgi:O-antigen/teichoic acid export membrane protein
MKKQFLANIFLVLGLNLLVKPLYIFYVEAEVQNVVGTNVYGLYFELFNLCFIYQFFLDLGIHNYTSRFLSENRKSYDTYFARTLGTKILLSLGFMILVLSTFYLLNYDRADFSLLVLVAIEMILISVLMYLRASIAAMGFFRADSLISVLDKLLLLISLGFVLYFSELRTVFTIETFLYYQIICTSLVLLIAFFFLVGKISFPRISFSFGYSRKLFKKTVPFALVFLIMTLYTKMDGIMLGRLIDDNNLEAGIYAAGFRLIDALNTVGFLFSALLLPMFARLNTPTDRYELWEVAYRLLINVVIIGLLASLFYGNEILSWLYVDADSYYYDVFKGLIFSFCAMTLSFLFGIMITAKGNLKRLNIVYLLGVVINWSLNLWLIPQYLAEGAAYATLATQLAVLLGLVYLCVKDLNFRVKPKIILNTILYFGLSLLLFYLVKAYLLTDWVITMSFSIVGSILVSFLLGMLRLDLIYQFKNQE